MLKNKILFLCSLLGAVNLVACGRPGNGENDGFTRVIIGSNHARNLSEGIDKVFTSVDEMFAEWNQFAAPGFESVVYAQAVGNPAIRGSIHFTTAEMTGGYKTWVLPNGQYFFSMIGYDSVYMGSAPKCALGASGGTAGAPIDLAGGNTTVSFTSTACSQNTNFRDNNAYTNISVALCNNAIDLSVLGGGSNCTNGGGAVATGILSAKIVSFEKESFNGQNGAPFSLTTSGHLASGCIVPNNVSGIGSGPDFPAGNPEVAASATYAHLGTAIFMYTDNNCTETNLHSVYGFEGGLASAGFTGAFPVMGGVITNAVMGEPAVLNSNARWIPGTSPVLFLKQIN